MNEFWNQILGYLDASFGISLIREGNPQGYVNCIFMSITTIFGILLVYRALYLMLGIFGKSRTYKPAKDDKRYAFVFSARNEEKVIGNLIDSVREQNYNQKNIDIIVVADNCDDNTANIAREKGCMVYERHDLSKCRKGYALQFLFEHLKKDLPQGIETYYAYVFMDSDNVMAKDFLSKLNDAFQAGYDIATGYRNVKNADDNWLTALSAINWYRSVIVSLRARSILNSCAQIGGTGYGVRSYVIKDGWDYTMITEDGEMTTRLMAVEPSLKLTLDKENYEKLGKKKLYLSLPNGKRVSLKTVLGEKNDLEIPEKHLKKYAIASTKNELGDPCLKGTLSILNKEGETVFVINQETSHVTHYIRLGYVEKAQFFDEQPTTLKITLRQRIRWAKGGMVNWFFNDWKLFWSFIKHPRWSKYDIYWEMFPYGLWNFFMGFFQLLITTILWATGLSGNAVDGWQNIWSYLLNMTVIQYLGGLITGIPVIIKEWDKVHFTFWEAFGYIFLWPFYDMIGTPISIACLFMHVTWKPVPHHVIKNGDELMEVQRKKEEKRKNS